MRTTLALDDELVAKAQAFTGLNEKSSLVREALKALIERESARRLALLGGSEPDLETPPRRRSKPAMILVDTSVWVDHLRANNDTLASLLDAGAVLAHPFATGELAMGQLRQRKTVLTALSDLPQAGVATDGEILAFIDRQAVFGRGIGYVDVHLLAAVRLTAGAKLWTNDKRLHGVAEELGLAMV